MLTHAQLRTLIARAVADRTEQGFATDGLAGELESLPDSFDEMLAFAAKLSALPLKADWPYVEPVDIDDIRAECDPGRPMDPLHLDPSDAAARVEAAFYGRVCGCMLGKPFEIFISLDEIRAALETTSEWPIDDYPTERAVRALPRLQGQWAELVRERMAHVVPDDDINYTIIAMLALEQHGDAFTHEDLKRLWMYNLPVGATFGPERTQLLRMGARTLTDNDPGNDVFASLNPGEELCGALIRADAYGYACLGHPERAASLAHRDASLTHSRTGVYGPMFVAAAIAVAPFATDPLDIFGWALGFVPQRSRFAEAVRASITEVEGASGWIDGYERVHARFGEYGFCRILQEIGTVINTLRFANDVGHGICLQVMQGNDTDSFGATAGSILGAFFGPGHLEPRWTEPFNDDVHTALASFHERSLSKIAARMAALPARVAQ
jgi:ADP-ribosylglycohydrolase